MSFMNQGLKGLPADHNIELLEKYQSVGKEDVMRCLREYIVKLFRPESSAVLAVTAPGKSEGIADALELKGFKVENRTIEIQGDEHSKDESTSDSEGSER